MKLNESQCAALKALFSKEKFASESGKILFKYNGGDWDITNFNLRTFGPNQITREFRSLGYDYRRGDHHGECIIRFKGVSAEEILEAFRTAGIPIVDDGLWTYEVPKNPTLEGAFENQDGKKFEPTCVGRPVRATLS